MDLWVWDHSIYRVSSRTTETLSWKMSFYGYNWDLSCSWSPTRSYSTWVLLLGTSQERACSEELRSSCKPSVGSSPAAWQCWTMLCWAWGLQHSSLFCGCFVVPRTDPSTSHRLGKRRASLLICKGRPWSLPSSNSSILNPEQPTILIPGFHHCWAHITSVATVTLPNFC